MQFKLLQSLGTQEARELNERFNAGISTSPADLKEGSVVELSEQAADYLQRKYSALLESTAKVRGVSKQSEITAPAK